MSKIDLTDWTDAEVHAAGMVFNYVWNMPPKGAVGTGAPQEVEEAMERLYHQFMEEAQNRPRDFR